MVFLARLADGAEAAQRFLTSYHRFGAGIEHDLVVIYKGDLSKAENCQIRGVFDGTRHIAIEIPDVGFDIDAYLGAARMLTNEYLVLLNTHSEIVAADWLANLFRFASQKDVGVTAAMGSYESIRSSVLLFMNAIWKSVGVRHAFDPTIAFYFDFVMRLHHPNWYTSSGGIRTPAPAKRWSIYQRTFRLAACRLRRSWLAKRGTSLIWPGAAPFDYMQFPAFPNPHVRSNCFMIRRDRFVKFHVSSMGSKVEANLFESGPESMTRSVVRDGLRTIVVDCHGNGYDMEEWPYSSTFRLGDQSGLLIHDNHTRAFASMSVGARATHERITWGDFLKPAPDDFPDLGVGFGRVGLPAVLSEQE